MLSAFGLPTSKASLVGLFSLMRPRQWVKNAFVLAPLIFAGEVANLPALLNALIAVALFCAASSATYIVNDLKDIESDRRHPTKSKSRPLASGAVQRRQALVLLVLLYAVLAAGFVMAPAVVAVIVAYLVLNVCYTFALKHQPVVDIFVIALGFVLRVYAGAQAIEVPLSSWTFVTTLCLALYLASVKRRQELLSSGADGRQVLRQYTVGLVDRYAEISATGALLFYSLYVMNAEPGLVVTIPLVLFGLFRYWFVVETQGGGESPTDALLADWQLQVTIILWVVTCAYVLHRSGG